MEDGHEHQPEVVAEEHPLEAADGELDLPLPDHPGHEEDGGGELAYDGEEPPPPPPPPPPHDEHHDSCCSKAAAAPVEVHLDADGAAGHHQPDGPAAKRPRIEDHPGDVAWESLMGEFPVVSSEFDEDATSSRRADTDGLPGFISTAQVRGQLQTFTPDEW